MNGSIYIIKNTVNNKIYIGQTIQDVTERFKQHLRLCKSNKNQLIYKAIKKYSKEKFYFEILETGIKDYKTLNTLEEKYINEYNSLYPNGYNLCPGGQKWRRQPKLSEVEISEICNMYISGYSTRSIGELFDVSHHTILTTLKTNGIKMRSKSCNLPDRTSKINKDELIELYCDKNLMIKEIATILNVCEKTIYRAIKRYKLKEYNTGK